MENHQTALSRVEPVEEFVGKDKDKAIAENMKKKFGLTKWRQGYDINLMNDQGFHLPTHILARKIIRKCRASEVPALMQ